MKGNQMELIWMSLDVYHLPRNPCQNASCRRSTSDAKKKRLSAARSASQRDKRDGLSWVYHQKIQDNHSDLVRPMDIYTYVFCSYVCLCSSFSMICSWTLKNNSFQTQMAPLAVAVGEPIATAVPVRPRQSFPPGKCRPFWWISTGTVYPFETLVRQLKIPIFQWKIPNSMQIIQFQMVNQGKIHGNHLQNENLRARPLPRRPGSTPGGAGMVMCWKIIFWVFQCVSICFIGFWSIHHINSTTLGHRFHLGLKKVGWSIPIFPITAGLPCAICPFFWAKRKKRIKTVSYLISRYKPH